MGIRTRNAFRPVIEAAVREGQAATRALGGTVGRSSTGLPARTVTTPRDGPRGRTTQYPAMTEIDSTESDALTS